MAKKSNRTGLVNAYGPVLRADDPRIGDWRNVAKSSLGYDPNRQAEVEDQPARLEDAPELDLYADGEKLVDPALIERLLCLLERLCDSLLGKAK